MGQLTVNKIVQNLVAHIIYLCKRRQRGRCTFLPTTKRFIIATFPPRSPLDENTETPNRIPDDTRVCFLPDLTKNNENHCDNTNRAVVETSSRFVVTSVEFIFELEKGFAFLPRTHTPVSVARYNTTHFLSEWFNVCLIIR